MTQSATVFSFDYPPLDGGIARLCAAIVQSWKSKGRAVTVLSSHPVNPAGGLVPVAAEVRVRKRRPWRELSAARRLRAAGRGRLVLCGTWYPEGLVAQVAGCENYVVLAHGAELFPPPEPWAPAWRMLRGRVLRGARLVVANSAYTAGLVEREVPGARVEAVPLAVDHVRFCPSSDSEARSRLGLLDSIVLTTVSRVHAFKGHEVVLEALAQLSDDMRPRFIYQIAGKGPDLPRLRDLSRSLGVADQVRFLEFVGESQLPDLYRATDLFVLCTREQPKTRSVEGFGLVFLEAQAAGVPVVGTRTGGIPDAVEPGNGGWLIEQDDAAGLSAILERAVRDPLMLKKEGERARIRVLSDFTWDHYMERLDKALATHGIRIP